MQKVGFILADQIYAETVRKSSAACRRSDTGWPVRAPGSFLLLESPSHLA
jgi:hypothetical protein